MREFTLRDGLLAKRGSLGWVKAVQLSQPLRIWPSTQTVPARSAFVGNAPRTPPFLAHRKRIKHRESSDLLHRVCDGMLMQDLIARPGILKVVCSVTPIGATPPLVGRHATTIWQRVPQNIGVANKAGVVERDVVFEKYMPNTNTHIWKTTGFKLFILRQIAEISNRSFPELFTLPDSADLC